MGWSNDEKLISWSFTKKSDFYRGEVYEKPI